MLFKKCSILILVPLVWTDITLDEYIVMEFQCSCIWVIIVCFFDTTVNEDKTIFNIALCSIYVQLSKISDSKS